MCVIKNKKQTNIIKKSAYISILDFIYLYEILKIRHFFSKIEYVKDIHFHTGIFGEISIYPAFVAELVDAYVSGTYG